MQTQSISTNIVQQKSNFLRRALQANALFSLLTGAAFVVASGPIARFIGTDIPSTLVLIVGLGLLPFGYMVYRLTSGTAVSPKEARIVTIMDVSWVIGSFLLLALGWSLFTVAGRWFIALQAEAVATFTLLQIIGLRRL
ncbi:hypothetical protein MNBD_CHLOROFLEXI01-3419 [hydrothermal vent metagenome]|uniref:Uncharacterized protein n=1 Tax=hydrothermal vent metagenome TaxID=652676 RepID=A0A3B0VHH0_9ZZZZ